MLRNKSSQLHEQAFEVQYLLSCSSLLEERKLEKGMAPPILLQFEFSSLASEQMQNHFGQVPFLVSLLHYSNAPLFLQSTQGKICIRVDIPDYI